MPLAQIDEHAIFSVAVQIPSPKAREEYLLQVCSDNTALFDRVSALVAASEKESSFLEQPPSGVKATLDIDEAPSLTGTRIGPYKILQEIGAGGFGVVYMAEQLQPVMGDLRSQRTMLSVYFREFRHLASHSIVFNFAQ